MPEPAARLLVVRPQRLQLRLDVHALVQYLAEVGDSTFRHGVAYAQVEGVDTGGFGDQIHLRFVRQRQIVRVGAPERHEPRCVGQHVARHRAHVRDLVRSRRVGQERAERLIETELHPPGRARDQERRPGSRAMQDLDIDGRHAAIPGGAGLVASDHRRGLAGSEQRFRPAEHQLHGLSGPPGQQGRDDGMERIPARAEITAHVRADDAHIGLVDGEVVGESTSCPGRRRDRAVS